MCGIAGIIGGENLGDTRLLKLMTGALSHRGPDGDGHWISPEGLVGLGHRRLAVIDLSDGGRQPMRYADGRFTITYNGEIYNYIELRDELKARGYSFSTECDTEVLLALFAEEREDCLQFLDGMFAFAIWDREEHQLFCARDRFGEKPFYYSMQGDRLFFASEMKALWAAGLPREAKGAAIFNYLAHGDTFDPTDATATFYEGIYKLPAAHYFIARPNETDPKPIRYWDIDQANIDTAIGEKETIERFRELLLQSVRRRLRSDVKVGSSLSGGLDSSVIVSAVAQLSRNENFSQSTFSARFPGFARDEGRFMQTMIDSVPNVHPLFVFPTSSDLADDLDQLIYHQEEPFGSSSIYAQFAVMRLAKENGTTVMLDGQGADELLAGYHYYFSDYFREIRRGDKSMYASEKSAFYDLYRGQAVSSGPGIRSAFVDRLPPQLENNLRVAKDRVKHALSPLMSREFYAEFQGRSHRVNICKPKTLGESLARSTTGGALEELLRYADRNSMAHSREVRLPFLSHELAEFVFSLPAQFKIRGGVTKYVMRRAFSEDLPREIINRHDKIGYETPQQRWLEDPSIVERMDDAVSGLKRRGIVHDSFNYHSHGPVKSWRVLLAGLMT